MVDAFRKERKKQIYGEVLSVQGENAKLFFSGVAILFQMRFPRVVTYLLVFLLFQSAFWSGASRVIWMLHLNADWSGSSTCNICRQKTCENVAILLRKRISHNMDLFKMKSSGCNFFYGMGGKRTSGLSGCKRLPLPLDIHNIGLINA